MFSFVDASELTAVARDFTKISKGITPALLTLYREGGEDLAKEWAADARPMSGVHGKHYPDSIDSEFQISTNIYVEVGPNPLKPQGKMVFETGSVNQPPHPAGQMAADRFVPRFEKRVDQTLFHLGL